jgi:predicted membrane protein
VTDRLQIVGLVLSVLLLLVVLELVRRRKLIEEYSFIWILFSLTLLAVSVRRENLHAAARWLGAFYPPIVLVMLLIGMVFVASLCHSVIVSRQRQQIERLIEETAILSAELREVRAAQPPYDRRRERFPADRRDTKNVERHRPSPKRPAP